MRKLQELSKRISHKVRPKVTLIERLRIPTQQEHQSSVFPTAPDEVKSWLLTHGAFNTSGAVKTLTRALQYNNRAIATPEKRLQALEHFEQPFIHSLKSLDTHYLYVDFPLSNESESAFQTALILCQEMAYGYKIALTDSLKKGGKLNKAQKQLAISRAMENISRLTLRHSHIYRDWPNDIWSDANTLMQIAKLEKVASMATTEKIKKDVVSLPCIEQQYTKLCLFYLFDDKRRNPEQLHSLFTALSTHCSEVTLSTTKPNTLEDEYYCVGENNPPVVSQFCQYKKSDMLMYFSLGQLLTKIKNDHSQSHNTAIESVKIQTPNTHQRGAARTPHAAVIHAQTGLKNIFKAIRTTPPSDLIESQFTDVNRLSLSNRATVRNNNDTLNSVNTEQLGGEFIVENQSTKGLGLSWSGNGSCRASVGELIAHCYEGKDNEVSWYIGVVRWLKTHADQSLNLGVEKITEHANAVEVHRLVKNSEHAPKPSAALLANCQLIDSKVKMLILPMHEFKPGETIGYRDNQGFYLVKLIESVELGGGFQCFAITSASEDITQRPDTQTYINQFKTAI